VLSIFEVLPYEPRRFFSFCHVKINGILMIIIGQRNAQSLHVMVSMREPDKDVCGKGQGCGSGLGTQIQGQENEEK
jgi:hypothetical protein